MAEAGDRPVHGPVHQRLAPGVGQVFLAADHVGHAHVVIIDGDGQIVGRGPVGAQDHQVFEVLVGEGHPAAHGVLDHRLAVHWGLEADHMRLVDHRRIGRAIPPGRAHGMAGDAGGGLGLLAFLGRHPAPVRPATLHQLSGDVAMPVGSGELEHRGAVVLEPQPLQAVENHLHRRLGGALPVGVLDPEQEHAAAVACIKPVEQGRPGVANMHGAGGRGGDTGDDG